LDSVGWDPGQIGEGIRERSERAAGVPLILVAVTLLVLKLFNV
jgi:hypothetical protein